METEDECAVKREALLLSPTFLICRWRLPRESAASLFTELPTSSFSETQLPMLRILGSSPMLRSGWFFARMPQAQGVSRPFC